MLNLCFSCSEEELSRINKVQKSFTMYKRGTIKRKHFIMMKFIQQQQMKDEPELEEETH